MLAALERGNDQRKWHTLVDKVFSPKTLGVALQAVVANAGAPGIDGITTREVAQNAASQIALLERQLREGHYQPKAVKRVWIEKPGSHEKRPLGLPCVRDRIVQKALQIILEPIFEREFAEQSYGFRPGRGARQAVERVESLLKEGKVWVVDADIQGYFDNIPHEPLLERVKEKIADARVLALLEKFLQQGVMESAKDWTPSEKGTPQGAVISPLLANVYLDPLDHLMESQGRQMIRYADDFVLLCTSREEAEEVLAAVRHWTQAAGLTLHPEKTRIVDATQRGGFEFLGWHFERGLKWPREKSQHKFKETLRAKTKRSSGQALPAIIAEVNRTVRGWGNYFRGGVLNVPKDLEEWLRMRLRSVLRKRDKRKGKGRGLDHHRYTIAWFAVRGLISLTAITHAERPLAPSK
jgi:RNA-directed DNA polymerase